MYAKEAATAAVFTLYLHCIYNPCFPDTRNWETEPNGRTVFLAAAHLVGHLNEIHVKKNLCCHSSARPPRGLQAWLLGVTSHETFFTHRDEYKIRGLHLIVIVALLIGDKNADLNVAEVDLRMADIAGVG